MHLIIKATAAGAMALGAALLLANQTPQPVNTVTQSPVPVSKTAIPPKIQVAILLDVSNSMDGLIAQAKTQLWNMVNTLGKADCNGVTPSIEIALYEYGRDTNPKETGFVKQITGFTKDLDKLSLQLFALNTNGGDEYCGKVIQTAVKQLPWDNASSSYKVIFIAGNEDFLQGPVNFSIACGLAGTKGVIVNTIYCGDRISGIREHWNLGGECGNGSFTNINQSDVIEDIPTPYDDKLITLNEQLNGTYIAYGSTGNVAMANQSRADQLNIASNKSAGINRIITKGKKELYKNESWDLVDAARADSAVVAKVVAQTLPDSLRRKSPAELKKIVQQKSTERQNIQSQIDQLSVQRAAYLAQNQPKKGGENLQTAIENILRQQAKRYNMVIKK